jgi:hypothetical protein
MTPGKPTLTDLARQFGCDKYFRHSYMPTYEELLAKRKVRRLLEVGIGFEGLMKEFVPFYVHGASLKMWSAYWPEAEIWACDIREDTLINEGNIRSVVCDQASPLALLDMIHNIGGCCDVIIDDGSHQFEHQVVSAVTLLPYVCKGGVYIIEDTYWDKGAELAKMFGGRVIVGSKTPDDTMVVIER